jgi:Glycerophosphoryl diester phosphodiesterase
MNKSLNIAHRGFSAIYPENTMLAFIKAVEAGCNGIETDLHRTKDGVLVICHDEDIDRTTNGTGFIKDYTYKELCSFDAGIKYGKEFQGERIPSLDELLDYIKDKDLLINLELKNDIFNYDGIEKQVIDKVHEYKVEKNIILSSFNHYSMIKAKEYDSNIKTGVLCAAILYNVHEYVKTVGADALHPFFPSVFNEKIVNEIKNSGIMINAYTVDDVEHMKRLIDLEIDGIITNYPDKLKDVLDSKSYI